MSTGATGAFSYADTDHEEIEVYGDQTLAFYRRKFWEVLRDHTIDDEKLSNEEVLKQWTFEKSTRDGAEHHCICTHYIIQNCFIRNIETNEELIVGNVCIKRWMPAIYQQYLNSKKRHCDMCGQEHKNRKNNFCNTCREDMKWGKKSFSNISLDKMERQILNVGKHSGKTFKNIRESDSSYCKWVKKLDLTSGSLAKFATYLERMEEEGYEEDDNKDDTKMPIGKHKDKTFKTIWETDQSYCSWVLKLDKPTGIMAEFQSYIQGMSTV